MSLLRKEICAYNSMFRINNKELYLLLESTPWTAFAPSRTDKCRAAFRRGNPRRHSLQAKNSCISLELNGCRRKNK